ncbi:MAG: hypothetical protein ACODAC_00505 [Pseudomonadota bacterium]
MNDRVLESLELAAERGGDLTADAYQRYYAASAEAERLMSHVDPYMQGRMMDEVLALLMAPPEDVPADYLRFETANHASYGVGPHLYRPLFEAVRESVRAVLGDDWNDGMDAAWATRITGLLARIEAVAPERHAPA